MAALIALVACSGEPVADGPDEVSSAGTESAAEETIAPFRDALRTAPDHYHLLFETEGARVLSARWRAGERDAPHSHPTAFWFALTDAELGIEVPGALPLGRRIAAGQSGLQQPIQLHTVENRGDRPAELLIFEIQPAAGRLFESPPGSAPLALTVSNRFRLLEAHGGYRLLLATLEPGQKDRLHSHPESLWFALTDVRLRLTQIDREPIEVRMAPGDVQRFEPTRAHTADNLTDRTARILILEIPSDSVRSAL